MNRKNTARNAFVTSVISLLLCVSMLVGTTFAWFTDEVVSGNNVIKSGTLDIEFLWGETADAITTDASQGAIFDYQYWEPGYTQVRYVKIANVGNLALRYRLNINPNMQVNEGEVNLAEVIDVRMIPAATAANMTRAQMLEVAPAGTLASLMADVDGAAHGVLLPDPSVEAPEVTLNAEDAAIAVAGAVEYCIVLHMQEEAGNEYQNLSVGEGFSVQLLATQYTYENDSFDNTYDDGAEYDDAPNANVTTFDPQWIETSTHGNVLLEAGFQFKPEETYEEALNSPYAKWHADFVVYSDKDIPANAVILPGYYAAYCDGYNDGKWVGLSSDDVITAGTQIRLIDVLGELMNGTVYVNYEEICKWGNDDIGFMCGVSVDEVQRAAIAGTTITVELRIYETKDPADTTNNTTNEETGNYQIIGTYTYTIPAEAPVVTP